MSVQALVSSTFQADQQMQQNAWLASLPNVPGPRGADLEAALLTCITNTSNSPAAGQGWGLVSRPIISFAVTQLEKGTVKAAELADALLGIYLIYLIYSHHVLHLLVICAARITHTPIPHSMYEQ